MQPVMAQIPEVTGEARRCRCWHHGPVPSSSLTGPTQYANSGGMFIALAALVVVMLLCRWVFSTTHRDVRTARRLARAQSSGDYGLLVQVATVRTDADATLLRAVLSEAGIRGTVSGGRLPGEQVVLVFRSDADRARSLVSSR